MKVFWDGRLLRVVLDTSVIVSAFRSDQGASYRLLRLAWDGKISLLATPALFLEYEDVLSRPEQMRVHGFSLKEIDTIMQELTTIIEPVEVHFQWRPQLTDADDEMVLEAAMNGRANCLVTHNVKDFKAIKGRFAMRVLRPAELLKEIEP